MVIKRRSFVQGAAAVAAFSNAGPALAQADVFEQAKIMIGFPPGSGSDSVARLLAEEIRGKYARVFIIDNKPGASARLAVDEVNRGPIDGSMMVMQPDAVMALQPHVDPKNTNYKFEDLSPVVSVGQYDSALIVGPMVPESVRTFRQFIEWANANPQKASYGIPAAASPQDFLMKVAMKENSFELTQVPYKGGAQGLRDLMGGQVAAMFTFVGDTLPLHRSGKARIVGTSGIARTRFTPDIPTFEEQGFKGMSVPYTHMGLWMKREVPDSMKDRLHDIVNEALKRPSVAEGIANIGYEVHPISRADFAKAAQAAYQAWGDRVSRTGYKPAE